MRKIILLTLLMNFIHSYSQDFQGYALYISKTIAPKFEGGPGKEEVSPEMRRNFEEQMKKALQKTFVLHFNKSESLYQEEEKLENSNQLGGSMLMPTFADVGSIHYKNIKTKIFSQQKDFFGKEFSINDSLVEFNW